jgi:2-hydroxy-3-oxopropionate reductase
MSDKIGFVGLGIMGGPMARNVMDAGYDLVLFNRTRPKAEELVKDNPGEVADTISGLARQSDVVITMLPGPPEVEAVYAGEGGLLESMRQGTLLVDMSTSSPVLARGLAREAAWRGIGMLDAPVSGGDVAAEQGTLSIMVGGEETDYSRAHPLFEVMGETIVHVGESGAGQVTKAANQIVVAIVLEAVSEALVLGSRAGVEPPRLIEVLSGGLAANRAMEVKRDKLLGHDFEPGGKVEFHHKDLGIALEAGREYGVSLPVTALVDQMFGELKSRGRGEWDHSALLTLIEARSAHRIGEGTQDYGSSRNE